MTTEPAMRTSPHASKTAVSIAGHGTDKGNTVITHLSLGGAVVDGTETE